MRTRTCTIIIAVAASIGVSAAPVTAQHRGGGGHGHGGGGHSGGRHASGGHAGGGHAGGRASQGSSTHTGGDRQAPAGHVAVGHAVPRPTVIRPQLDHRTTFLWPVYSHVGAFAGSGLGFGAYGYPYSYGYYPGYRYRYGYGYPGYDGYSSGYYDGHARLRILDAPPDAQVFVDGYYAGIVDNFDGLFQHLELTPGPHQIEIRANGFAPLVFEVNAVAGRTITYRARMIP